MQNSSKLFKIKIAGLFLLVVFYLTSCTTVYFEKPVPEAGKALTSIPSDWSGLYISEPAMEEETNQLDNLFRQCFRLERLSASQLLVSTEYRIHERNLPQLKEALEKQKQDGSLTAYHLSESLLLCTTQGEDGAKQQYSTLIKQGPWYILAQTIAPFRMYDLEAGLQTEFEIEKQASLETTVLPEANSISNKISSLVARKDRKGWYFNTQEQGATNWMLLYVEQADRNHLIVKLSQLENSNDFKNRFDYFNAITPFGDKESDHFEINPDDAALTRLLAEEGLFQTTHLRRLNE